MDQPVDPHAERLRSPLYPWYAERGARFVRYADAVVAADAGHGTEEEAGAARHLALLDCSTLPRVGFKGAEALAWAGAQGVAISETNNRAVAQAEGGWAARLADSEVLVLADPLRPGERRCAALEAAWTEAEPGRCALILRRHVSGWLCLLGEQAAGVLAKLSAVDLRPARFADGGVAQTSIARTGAIIVRADLGPILAYHVLPESASVRYLWGCLLDAMDELGGVAIGLDGLRAAAQAPVPGF